MPDCITAGYEETLGDALANFVLQERLVENACISRSTLRDIGGHQSLRDGSKAQPF